MGFKDIYYSLEEKFNKSIDYIDSKIPVRGFFNAIDKVMPSFIFVNLILLLLIVGIALFIFWPNNQDVTITFKSNGVQLIESFDFSLNVDGKDYLGKAEKGQALITLKKGDKISIDSISIKDYVISEKYYDFSNNISVKLKPITTLTQISLFLFNTDGSSFTKEANLSFSCSNANLDDSEKQKVVLVNDTLNVPNDCGTLNISAQVDGYNLTKGQICDSTACSLEFSAVTNTIANFQSLPNGALKVTVVNEIGEYVQNAKVKIYDASNLVDEIDFAITNTFGTTKTFSNLPIGRYSVYVSSNDSDYSEDVTITENSVSDFKLVLSRKSINKLSLSFVNEDNKLVSGEFALTDSLGKIVYRATTSGKLEMPVYNYGKFYYDFKPNDSNLFPLAGYVIDIDSTTTAKTILVKKATDYKSAKINISVFDEDSNPVEGAQIFVKDAITGFDLIAYGYKNTDKNGLVSFLLPEGAYVFRSYTGFSEALSEQITVAKSVSGDTPQIDIKINMSFGYSLLNLKVLNEYSEVIPNAKVTFYKKQNYKVGTKLTDSYGVTSNSFKAGNYVYYKVEKENYLTYYSEARLLMTNYIWDENVKLKPIGEEIKPKVEYLGLFDTINGKESKSMNIGDTYYVGFKIYIYDDFDELKFKLTTGDQEIVDKDKLYIIDAFTSSDYDVKYSDKNEDQLTLGDAKTIISEFNNSDSGIYTVYYKLNVRNSSSVKLYDSLRLSWELILDDDSLLKESKEFLAGTKTICADEEICGRYTLLNKQKDLYVDSFDNKFILNPGTQYDFTFDLINGIDGSEGELKSGKLEIYNALSSDLSSTSVKNNISANSFLHLSNYELNGPESEKSSFEGSLFGLFVENYSFNNYLKNRYISGKLSFNAVSESSSYLNFIVVDNDRKIVVQGKPAMSLLFDAQSVNTLSIKTFPDRVIAPNSDQILKVFVIDDTNTKVKDAYVSVRVKKPLDNMYRVLSYCKDLISDEYGLVNCNLSANDMVAGTYIQVIAEKENYSGYSKKDFSPDLQVTTKMFDFDKEKLNAKLIYPVQQEAYDSLGIVNNTAKDIVIDHLELIFSNYSQDEKNYLNTVEMQNYIKQIFNNKVILGRQLNYDNDDVLSGEAKTELNKIFKAALNDSASEITKNASVSGALKIYFKTQNEAFDRTIPFGVDISSNGYPTNDNCLSIEFADNKNSFASDNAKLITIPIMLRNNCIIQNQNDLGNNTNYYVNFENAYVVLNHTNGALGLGKYTFNTANGYADLVFSVPKEFTNNWEANDNIEIGSLNLEPNGIYGKENLSLKIFGLVKTSNGYQKVESKELAFSVSVLNIDDCIKVYDDKGTELEKLNLEPKENIIDTTNIAPTSNANKFELTIKNICDGLPIDLKLCSDDSKSCGQIYNNQYVGFRFDNSSNKEKEILNFTGEKKIDISRPQISGAYALDIYAKQKDQDYDYKRILSLPVNVKTVGYSSPFFFDDPFLDVHYSETNNTSNNSTNNKYSSDARTIYNIDIPGALTITSVENFENLVAQDKGSGTPFYLGDLTDVVSNTSRTENASKMTIGALATVGGATVSILMLAKVGALASLSGGPLGWAIGGTVVALLSGIYLLATAFDSHISDHQDNKFVILDDYKSNIISVNENTIYVNKENINYKDIFNITGQNHYAFIILRESIAGNAGCQGAFCSSSKTWGSEELKFNATCPIDYEVDSERIFVLPESKVGHYEDCIWDKDPTVSGRTVTFYPKCSEDSFGEVSMDTYVVVPCKLKTELWQRASQNGVSDGYYNVGQFDVQFNNIDFNTFYNTNNFSCNDNYCYKIYPMKIDGGILGQLNSDIRVAFKNPKPKDSEINIIGNACSDVQGNVIGFTGKNARPKITYYWENIDEDFCSSDANNEAKQYCDATQFMSSIVGKIKIANDSISTLGNQTCPKLDAFFKYDAKQYSNSTYFDKILLAQDDKKPEKLYIQTLKYLDYSGDPLNIPKYKTYIQVGDKEIKEMDSTQETTFVEIEGKQVQKIGLLSKYELYSAVPKDLPDGNINLLNKNVNIVVYKCNTIGTNCESEQVIPITVNIGAYNWKGGCLITNPSTSISEDNGKMQLFDFYSDDKTQELFEIQDTLNYNAYLMDDGYSQDFLEDFYNYAINNTFANYLDVYVDELDLKTKAQNGTFKIVNQFGETKNDGPGKYIVNINITYPEAGNYILKDANILVTIKKRESVVNDNMFYYLPFDGLVGIENEVIDRQGYGIGLSGDSINIDDSILNEQLSSNYDSSNAKTNVIVKTSADFSQMNSFNGTIFNAEKDNDNVNVLFIPDLSYWIVNMGMKNKYLEQNINLDYSLNYNSDDLLNDSVILTWFAKDSSATDFTGNKLYNNYPRKSKLTNKSNVARLEYNSESVTTFADYSIYSIIYGKKGSSLNLDITNASNLDYQKDIDNQTDLGIDNLNAVLNAISDEQLCVAKDSSKNKTRIFVNTEKIEVN